MWKFTGEGLEGNLVRRGCCYSSETWISLKLMLLFQPHRKAVVNSGYDISLKFFQCLAYNIMFHLYPQRQIRAIPKLSSDGRGTEGQGQRQKGMSRRANSLYVYAMDDHGRAGPLGIVLPGKANLRWWRDWLTMDLSCMVGKTVRFIRTLACSINCMF